MRKLTFTNSAGTSIVFGDATLSIRSITGIGETGQDDQNQKAPFQDGETYIDTLLNAREITLEGIINKAQLFTAINTQRDLMLKTLNPKLGEGTILYEYDGGSREITAVPTLPVFSNKVFQNPWQNYQVTFKCHDPYWRSATDTTINLPTPVTGSQTVITATANSASSIKRADNKLMVAYRRGSDGFLVHKTSTDGTTWSAETVINGAAILYCSLKQLLDGSYICAYVRDSDDFLVHRTSADGITWSAETVINGAASAYPSIVQLLSGGFVCAYTRISDDYVVCRTSTTGATWSDPETVINGAVSSNCSLIQRSDTVLMIAYIIGSGNYLMSRTSTDFGVTWSTEATIVNSSTGGCFLIQRDNNTLYLFYIVSTNLYQKASSNFTTWSDYSVVDSGRPSGASAVFTSNVQMNFFYTSFGGDVVTAARTVTSVPATVTGHTSTPIIVRLDAPSVNPRVVNADTLEYIGILATLAAGDYFIINTAFGKKSVELWQGGVKKNGMAFLDINSTFFDLSTGVNTVYYEDDEVASSATATLTFTERYLGL